MGIKELPGKIGYRAVKEVASFIAPLTALASTAGSGGNGYLDNLTAVYHVPEQLYHTGAALVRNTGIRDFSFERLGNLGSMIADTADNVVNRPTETAIAAGIVYGLTRFLPHIVKGAFRLVRKVRGKRE